MAAHVPHDGGRESGTRVLRSVRGVRRPRHAGMCPIGAPDGRGRDDSRAIQRGSTSPTHVPYLAVSFRRPTTWKTFAILQKMGFSWTNRLPTFCATVQGRVGGLNDQVSLFRSRSTSNRFQDIGYTEYSVPNPISQR